MKPRNKRAVRREILRLGFVLVLLGLLWLLSRTGLIEAVMRKIMFLMVPD